MSRNPTDMVQLKLRFKEQLRRKLDRAAREGHHSLNSEIILRLEASFKHDKWREQLERLLLVLSSLPPEAAAPVKRLMAEFEMDAAELEDDAERDLQEEVMKDLSKRGT
jgi:hypothetical protein